MSSLAVAVAILRDDDCPGEHLATLVAGMPWWISGWGWGDGGGSGRCRCPARWACGDGPLRFVAGVQMRCRECAAEVAVTARVCSRCGAPIVGQPPVVADTVVADTVVGAVSDAAVSDAAGKALPAGWPSRRAGAVCAGFGRSGSLRSFGWCWLATPVLLVVVRWRLGLRRGCSSFSFSLSTVVDPDDDLVRAVVRIGLQCAFFGGSSAGVQGAPGPYPVFQAAPAAQRSTHGHGDGLEAWWAHADTRHHPRDGTGRGYQPLSEVRLALWTKAGMLVPGETVNGLWRAGR